MSGPDLVTGATGFIGGHLARRLVEAGGAVRALCRPGSERRIPAALRARLELVPGDLGDRASLRRATDGARRVFHCAAEVSDWGPPARFEEANVRATRWLLEGARDGGIERFVHLSSFVVFGCPSPPVVDDACPYAAGEDPYSRTKARGEAEVFAFHREHGLPVTVLRPTVVYGPGSTWLEEPIRMMKRGAFFLLGGGAGTCHPCYVENLVDAALLAAGAPRAVGEGYLVADDEPMTFREYFTALATLAREPPPRRSIPVPLARALAAGLEAAARVVRAEGRPLLTQTAIDLVTTRSTLSIAKIRRDLGFAPRWSFREAVAATAAARASG